MSAVYFGDLGNTALMGQSLAVAARSTNLAGTAVDMLLGDGNNTSLMLSVVSYDIASGNETYAFLIEESDDNSAWTTALTNLANSTLTSKSAVGGDLGTAYIEVAKFQRTKRYVRVSLTVGGTTPAWTGTAVFMERLKITGSGAGYQA